MVHETSTENARILLFSTKLSQALVFLATLLENNNSRPSRLIHGLTFKCYLAQRVIFARVLHSLVVAEAQCAIFCANFYVMLLMGLE